MQYFAAVALVSIFLCLGVFAQTNTSSRPRVAPTATPPTIVNDPYANPPAGDPPVLIGGRKSGAAAPTQANDDGVIKIQTNLVTMPVSVLDRDGRFISGLEQRDFRIFEDGIEQKVDYFQSVEQPFTVALLIDVSPSTSFRIEEIQNAAIAFVNQLRPNDRVIVISFDQNVHVLSPVTNDRRLLINAIRTAEYGDGTSLYEAVDYAINNEMRQIKGRKAVVLFTDGVDTTSKHASYASTVAETEEIDALFYTVRWDTSHDMAGSNPSPNHPSHGGRVTMVDILAQIMVGGNVNMGGTTGTASQAEYEKGRKYLEALAQNSGGREFEAQSMYNIDAAFSGIAEELRRQYSLGYYPETVGKIGDRKQIKVRVMRPGVVVRAKNTYVVGQTDRNLAGK